MKRCPLNISLNVIKIVCKYGPNDALISCQLCTIMEMRHSIFYCGKMVGDTSVGSLFETDTNDKINKHIEIYREGFYIIS